LTRVDSGAGVAACKKSQRVGKTTLVYWKDLLYAIEVRKVANSLNHKTGTSQHHNKGGKEGLAVRESGEGSSTLRRNSRWKEVKGGAGKKKTCLGPVKAPQKGGGERTIGYRRTRGEKNVPASAKGGKRFCQRMLGGTWTSGRGESNLGNTIQKLLRKGKGKKKKRFCKNIRPARPGSTMSVVKWD